MYLWDSNTLRAYAESQSALLARLQQVNRSEVALPSVVVAEALRGRAEYALKADTGERLAAAHRLLMQTQETIATFQVIVFDEACGEEFERLRQRHRKHKRRADMLIASMARSGQHVVVTRNVQHFRELLPPDQIENWLD
jgi:predicted nucleic acid-binding protein